MSEIFQHSKKCRAYDCVCELGNAWNNTYECGVKRERERIIKLLEEKNDYLYQVEVDYVISLIKNSENVSVEIDNMSEGKNK